ncbi:hypothetical protein FRB97_008273 [Tulasnella sp. 331]|nr:hypothetical protein FRB97_008273 [Tulasnella sp. 331]
MSFQHIKRGIGDLVSRKSRWRRIVNYDCDASTLAAMKQSVANAIASIELETAMATNQEVDLLHKRQDAIYEDQQGLIRQQQASEYLKQLGGATEIAPLIASLGTQDSGSSKKPPCLDGTRVSLLNRIKRWIEKDRNEGVVVVLAGQLASWSEGRLRFDIANAIHEDTEIMRRTPEVQFRQLIQTPLQSLAGDLDSPTLVMLLDGLDECNEDYACRLLKAVGQSLNKLPTIARVIITSRPEPHLLSPHRLEPMRSQLVVYSLDTEKVSQVKMDIWKYFNEDLPGMVKSWVEDSLDWPGEERRMMLVELSQGLWIHTTTAARMLADRVIQNPEKQLEAVLSSHPILNRACPPNSTPDLLALFRDVLGTILVVQAPINIYTLASLLCPLELNLHEYTHGIRTTVLAYLQAVLTVPGVEEADSPRDSLPIRFIHKSFEDYLTDQTRCEVLFLLDTALFNGQMTLRCLIFLDLKSNICDLDASQPHLEVDGFARRLQDHVSASLQYACEQWLKHISQEPAACDRVLMLLEKFAQTQLLQWVEVVSLPGKMEQVISLIEIVQSWLKAQPTLMPESSELLMFAELTPEPPYRPLPGAINMCSINIPHRILAVTACAASCSTILHTDNQRHDLAMRLTLLKPSSSPRGASVPLATPLLIASHRSITTLLRELKCSVQESMVLITASSSHLYLSALPFMPANSALLDVYGHMAEGGPIVRRGRYSDGQRQMIMVYDLTRTTIRYDGGAPERRSGR